MLLTIENADRAGGISRRHFLQNTTKGIFSTALLSSVALANQPLFSIGSAGSKNVPLKKSGLLGDPSMGTGQQLAFRCQDPEPLPPGKRVGYAIVGLGKLSLEELLPAFGECKKSKLVALVSGSRDKAAKYAKQYGVPDSGIYDYSTYDSLKDNPAVDVIYIVLPNGMHAEYTIRGAKAGKHILCEKPMANTAKECEDMIKACKDAGKKLMIAYRIQYEPNNAEIKEMVRDRKYGLVKTITANNSQLQEDLKEWRLDKKLAGGGSLPDIGLYCLNTIRYLTGEEPHEVYGHIYNTPNDPRFKEVEENVLFQMSFPSGIQASCTTSYGQYISRNYRVVAEKAYFGMDPAFSYKGLKQYRNFKQGDKEVMEHPNPDEKNQFALEMDHMSECILNNKTPYTPGEEGLQDQKIMEAIYRSAEEKKPVKLAMIKTMDTFRGDPKQQG